MIQIAVDLDGTLTTEGTWKNFYSFNSSQLREKYINAKPNIEMIQKINEIDSRFFVFIFTSRKEKFRILTEKWLDENKVKYNKLIMNKPNYDLLIDDKAAKPEDFIKKRI